MMICSTFDVNFIFTQLALYSIVLGNEIQQCTAHITKINQMRILGHQSGKQLYM